jgi:hypothetical protein
MASRTLTPGHTSPTRREVAGSLLDQRQPPTLPKGLDHPIRKRAKALLEQNPHLWQDASQVEPIIRLARLRAQIDDLDELIAEQGYVVENAKGETRPNPLMASRDGVSRVAMQLERMLCIAFITRANQVKQAERVAPPKPDAVKTKQARVLRLA